MNPLFYLIFIIPIAVIVTEMWKAHDLNKVFNFRKELKKVKHSKYNTKHDMSNSVNVGTTGRKTVSIPDNAKHVFVCGTTGSGKTVALSNFIDYATQKNYPMLLVDGKGDTGASSMLEITKQFCTKNSRKLYIVNMNDPITSHKYNPFQNTNATIVKDMLINMTEWSEEHYKLNTERYLQRLVRIMLKEEKHISFQSIVDNMSIDGFTGLSARLYKQEIITKQEHSLNIEIIKASGKIVEGAFARFSTIIESEIGDIFSSEGIDIFQVLQENAVILFILNPLLYPELSPLLGRLILIDAKKAVSKMFANPPPRAFYLFDEINMYASSTLTDLVNKSRSANITSILATQSLSDLDYTGAEAFTQQIIENCNNYIVLRQNSAENAERWAKILGTRETLELTYQLEQEHRKTKATGLGSAKRVREFNYHPDEIKNLAQGKGFFLSKDDHTHCPISINKPF